jgi:hypothetical protein
MPSNSLLQWQGVRAAVLDEIEAAHAEVGGIARGRRYATQQINRAYAVLLSSEFQGFCRDLHSECVDLVVAITPIATRGVIQTQFLWGRSLDRGNPHAGGIGSDFGRFHMPFWDEVYAIHALNERRRELLDELITWRNAIAHNDFDPVIFGPHPVLHLGTVQAWRSALNSLCRAFDIVMRNRLHVLLGAHPWPP